MGYTNNDKYSLLIVTYCFSLIKRRFNNCDWELKKHTVFVPKKTKCCSLFTLKGFVFTVPWLGAQPESYTDYIFSPFQLKKSINLEQNKTARIKYGIIFKLKTFPGIVS